MTDQEAFDKALFGLRAQGGKSMDESGAHCQYRGAGGRKCGAGFVLPDSMYDSELEGCTAASEVMRNIWKALGVDHNLMAEIQDIHDSFDTHSWERMFENLAAEYGLHYTPPGEEPKVELADEPTECVAAETQLAAAV